MNRGKQIQKKKIVSTRNTKQKKLIMDVLKKEKSHPTIQELYQKIHRIDENIGQATVYRNVKSLVEDQKIKKLVTSLDVSRYDATLAPHDHFVCLYCGKLYDLNLPSLENNIIEESMMDIGSPQQYHLLIEGVCKKCLRIQNE